MRSYVSPSDLSSAISVVLDCQLANERVFNVASDFPIEMRELVAAADIPYVTHTSTDTSPWLVSLDNSRIKSVTGIHFRDNSAMAMIDDLRSVIKSAVSSVPYAKLFYGKGGE